MSWLVHICAIYLLGLVAIWVAIAASMRTEPTAHGQIMLRWALLSSPLWPLIIAKLVHNAIRNFRAERRHRRWLRDRGEF